LCAQSYIAYKLVGYLRWRGLSAQLFNVGKHRRTVVSKPQDASFFDSSNSEAQQQRDQLAFEVLGSMLDWLEYSGGDVAVFDATNTTNRRRWDIVNHVSKRSPQLRVIFIESMCDDDSVLNANYLVKAQNSPDYKNMPLEEALRDLKLRVANYERVYEPIKDDYLSYLKLINLNSKIICNRIYGQLGQIIASFLMSIHIHPRPIFLTRAGNCEGEDSVATAIINQNQTNSTQTERIKDEPATYPKISTNANLTARGRDYTDRLYSFITKRCLQYWNEKKAQEASNSANNRNNDNQDSEHHLSAGDKELAAHIASTGQGNEALLLNNNTLLPLVLYTSTLPRSLQTVRTLAERALMCESSSNLNMLDTGICSGLSIEEIKAKSPQELTKWQANPYTYRYPGNTKLHSTLRYSIFTYLANT
jgi:6-phosphofructo-2-kinase